MDGTKKQQSLYDEKIAKFKKEGYSDSEAVKLAGQWGAVPGYSEHQLGFAVDITGTAEEVWHYRYVGKEAAKEIYERGICLEEYLGN